MRRSKYTAVNKDRISRLPDQVISKILSCLPTIDAVGTCVLSKAWKNKWKSIHTIDIDAEECEFRWGFEDSEEMVKCLVNGVKTLLQHVRNVKAIFFRDESAVISNIDPMELKLIIARFLKYKAETLHIDLGQKEASEEMCDIDYGASVEIQGRLLNSATLKNLFFNDIFFEVPTKIHFPLLKTLHLQCVKISNENDKKSLKFTLPILETLDMIDCTWKKLKSVEIHAPCLQTLNSQTKYVKPGGYVMTEYDDEDVEIKIVGAASLVEFDSGGDYPENIRFIGSKVISVSMTHFSRCRDRDTSDIIAGNLLRECLLTLVELELSFYNVQNFWKALLESKHGDTCPMFNKLKRLHLSGRYSPFHGNTGALLCLLHAAPVLKSLVIKFGSGHWEDYDYEAVESSLPPSCILSTLEEIKLCLYIDFGADSMAPIIRLVKFLLQLGEKAQLKRFYFKIYLRHGRYLKSDNFRELISSILICRPPRFFTICITSGSFKKVLSFNEYGRAELVKLLAAESECS